MLRETKKNFLIDLLFFVTVAAIVYILFRFLAVYLFPFVIGLIITIFVQRPAKFISRHSKINVGICAMALVIFTYIAAVVIVGLLGYLVYVQGYKLAQFLPDIVNELTETFRSIGDGIQSVLVNMPAEVQQSVQGFINDLVSNIGQIAAGWIPNFAASVAMSTPEFIVVLIVTIVASCYIAKDLDKFKRFVKKWVNPKYLSVASEVKQIVYQKVFKLIKGYGIIMLITFVELSLGLLILRTPNAIFVAALIAIVDILPVLGCGTILIPWSVIALIRGNILIGIGVLVLYVIILIVRNVIEPKIIGDQVGLHPLLTLLAIFIGYRLLGVIGMFTLPIIAIVMLELYRRGKLEFLNFGGYESE